MLGLLRLPPSVTGNLEGLLVRNFNADVFLFKTLYISVDLPTLLVSTGRKLSTESSLALLSLTLSLALSLKMSLQLCLTLGLTVDLT